MKDETIKNLCLSLINAKTEKEVDRIIKDSELNISFRPYGGTTGNYSAFENQQSTGEAALIEDIVNGIDATLTRQCYVKGINPESLDAPQSMEEAKNTLFTEEELNSENIAIIADGDKEHVNLMIIDQGEGQEPKKFESTFLSLQKGNKNKIKFVQGKFNMGSTGPVKFSGKHNFKLIVSRRNCKLEREEDDYGFTLVRRHVRNKEEQETTKNTWYEYMIIDQEIPKFSADYIVIKTDSDTEMKYREGTLVKLFNYELKSRTQVFQSLKEEINALLYNPPININVYETRKDFSIVSKRNQWVMNVAYGNEKLLKNTIDKDEFDYISIGNIVEGIQFGSAKVDIFVLKENKDESDIVRSIRNSAPVVFLMNGQVQYSKNISYISSELGLKLIKKHIKIIIDCSELDKDFLDDGFFMANRENIRNTERTRDFINTITNFLKEHEELIRLNKERANQRVSSVGTQQIFEKLLGNNRKNSFLEKMFVIDNSHNDDNDGTKVRNKHSIKDKKEKYYKKFPTVVQIKGCKNGDTKIIHSEPGKSSSIKLKLDVEDNYFMRIDEPGQMEIIIRKMGGIHVNHWDGGNQGNSEGSKFNITKSDLKEGEINISFIPNEKEIKIGESYEITLSVVDVNQEFINYAVINIIEPSEKRKPTTMNKQRLNLPPVIQVYKDEELIKRLGINIDECVTWEQRNWTAEEAKNRVVEIVPPVNDNQIASAIYINMSSNAINNIIYEEGATNSQINSVNEQFMLNIYMQSFLLVAGMSQLQKQKGRDFNISEVEEFVECLVQETAYAMVKMQINNIKAAQQ